MDEESPGVVEWIAGRSTICRTHEKNGGASIIGSSRHISEQDIENADTVGEDQERIGQKTVEAFCPLCFSVPIKHPVELHTSTRSSSSRACLACSQCVAQWRQLLQSGTRPSLLPCPLCGFEVDNPAKDQALYPILDPSVSPLLLNNPTFSGSNEFHLCGRQPNPCGVCEEEKGTFMCLQCGFTLCPGCRATTHTKGRFREHEIISAEKAWQQGPRKCPLHSDQMLELFCQTCQTCVCISCCFKGSHRGDVVVPLPEITAETKEIMRQHVASFASAAQEAVSIEQSARALLPVYDNRLNEVRSEISWTFSVLREALKQREASLLEQLDTSSKGIQSIIEGQVNTAVNIAACLQMSQNGFEKTLETLNPVSFMESVDKIERSYETVFCFLRHQINAIEQFTTKFSVQLSDPQTCDLLVSFALFPRSQIGTPGAKEKTLRKYQEFLSQLGHLELLSDIVPYCNAEQVPSEVAHSDRGGMDVCAEAKTMMSSAQQVIAGDKTCEVQSATVQGKDPISRNLDIGLCLAESCRGKDEPILGTNSTKEYSSKQALVQANVNTSKEDLHIFYESNSYKQDQLSSTKPNVIMEAVNTHSSGIFSRKRPYQLNETTYDKHGRILESGQLHSHNSRKPRFEERANQDFARVRLESFLDKN